VFDNTNASEKTMQAYIKSDNFKWIQSESGNTYICPIDVVRTRGELSEEELQRLCVNESLNPQND
jgi:hypothetical protein